MNRDLCLLTGGWHEFGKKLSSRSVLFNTSFGQVVHVGKMHQPRYAHCSVFVQGEGVYVIGGKTVGVEPYCILDSCERFSLENNSWQIVAVIVV